MLRAGYVGSFGYHDLISIDPNSIPGTNLCEPERLHIGRHGRGTRIGRSRRALYAGWSAAESKFVGGFFWYAEGNSSYHALEMDVTRRMGQGLQLRGNFTWSKNLDNNSALQGAQANNQAQMVMDRNDLHRDWGLSALDATAQSSMSATYELPFGGHKRFLSECAGIRKRFDRRLAVQRDRDVAERLSFHAAARIESIGEWRYEKSRPAVFEC